MINPVDTAARKRSRHVARRDDRALTVDELARECRTTTRQVRALQSHGVVPHPRLVGRTGYYGVDHLERLRAACKRMFSGKAWTTSNGCAPRYASRTMGTPSQRSPA